MILIFGGAFQGKLDYARKHWNFNEDDIFYCDDSLAIDLSKKVIYGLEKFCFACVCEDADAKGILKMYDEPLTDKIIIDTDRRAWREDVGRTMLWLAKEADEVHRVFCGLGQRIK